MSEALMPELKVGHHVRFTPTKEGNRWWKIEARDEVQLILSMQAPFQPKGTVWYTILDLASFRRGPSNHLGGGYDCDTPGWSERLLSELQAGSVEISRRRAIAVRNIEHKEAE